MATLWERVRGGSKSGFDKAYKVVDKLGPPVNKLSNKLGSEAFWPTTLDKESDKAARILKSFCKDGFYAEEEQGATNGPTQKQKVLKKIPTKVIKEAKALAIFTTMRTGLWMSGASGSGVLIARKDDGSWSPPSGIMLHTAGLGFMVGIDIYDCVVVINSEKALEAFYKVRCTLGSEVSVAAGPIGAGGVLETEVHKRQAPIFTYMKSRGFYAGVQIDGTIVIERTDENERFYGQRIGAKEILNGQVKHPPMEVKRLLETIKAAQGDTDIDEAFMPEGPPPSDFEIDDGHMFGVPDNEDPDPYGVLALEKAGMAVRDAGTHERASWEQFSFNPSPTSPIHAVFAARTSGERPRSYSSRPGSWRTSTQSSVLLTAPKAPSSLRTSIEQPRPSPTMADSSTQTDFPDLPISTRTSARTSVSESRRSSRGSGSNSRRSSKMQGVPEDKVLDTSPERREPASVSKANGYTTPPRTPPVDETPRPAARQHITEAAGLGIDHDDEDDDDDDEHEEAQIVEQPVMHSIQTIQPVSVSQQNISKARLVTVAKRVAPKLPPRNPNRGGKGPIVIDASPTGSPREASPATSDRLSSRASHRSISPPSSTAHGSLTKGMEEIKLDDEDDEIEQRNPWAKVQEQRKSEEAEREKQKGRESMPGGFD
jgi:lipid-binding SYLF domain-containing protein